MAAVDLERGLTDFDPEVRQKTIRFLAEQIKSGKIIAKPENKAFNLHSHTFFSFNAYGYSPSSLAWLAKSNGFKGLGIVDFDTLDGVDEFLDACELVGIHGSAGIETRIFIPEFSTREINSPGEPGICYHMGIGFASGAVPGSTSEILNKLRQQSNRRNRAMFSRINQFLSPISVDYDLDVLPLTPNGNATERHILTAIIAAVEKQIPDKVSFWAKALNQSHEEMPGLINDPVVFSNLIRSKLMKRGGIGYNQPDPITFPTVEEFHELITSCGALPCYAWLDGTSAGEKDIRELLDFMVSKGVVAVNIIPDRNWNIADPEQHKQKVQNLYDFVALAREMDLPVIVGTEMNSPGNKLADEFDAPELAPLYPIFWEGACFIFGHTFLQRTSALGYLSSWAQNNFSSRHEKNAFYAKVGQLAPLEKDVLHSINNLGQNILPDAIIVEMEKVKVRSNVR
jgi:hypothetical protein